MEHETQIRVYYEDTDAGAFVFYANYLKFAERGRTELLRSLGFENKSLLDREGIGFVVRHIEAHYIKPAFLDDRLKVLTAVERIKNASVVMTQSIYRDQDLIFSMIVNLACVDIKQAKPVRFPSGLRNGFEKYLKERT